MDENAARRLIADHLGVTHALAVDAAGLRDLGADSLDLISLTLRMEEAFDVDIADEQASGCATVGDVLEVLSLAIGSRQDAELARRLKCAGEWS